MGLHKPGDVLLDALMGGKDPASAVVVAPGLLDATVALVGLGEAVVRHEKTGVEPQGAVQGARRVVKASFFKIKGPQQLVRSGKALR